jgi:hypothetical protein
VVILEIITGNTHDIKIVSSQKTIIERRAGRQIGFTSCDSNLATNVACLLLFCSTIVACEKGERLDVCERGEGNCIAR